MKKILIIEDDMGLQEELKYLLHQNGYESIVLTDFSSALDKMLDSQADLILLDITLPGIDGQYLLREFRKVSAIPVIMVTSKNTEMDEVLCMTYGADDISRGSMTVNQTCIELTKNEMRILAFLIKNKGKIVSRDSLISDLWESEEFIDDNTLTVNMTRIRKKLEDCGLQNMIKTKRGQGYLIE